MNNLEKLLESLPDGSEACITARNWAKGKTLSKAWQLCRRADWMLWILVKMAGQKGWPVINTVYHLIADCAETAIPIWEKYSKTDKRPQRAIKGLRDYADGKITKEQLKKLAYAAYATYAADAAADAAAYAAAAAAYAAAAAAYAADVAAYAADAAAYAAKVKHLAKMTDMIRDKVTKVGTK